MLEVILDSFKDSIKMFFFVFIAYVIFSFFDYFITNSLKKNKKFSPLFGALFGCVPQCGVSVICGDLYLKRSISIGTLIATFLACNDEGLILLITSNKALMAIPLLMIKILIGFSVGFVIDLLISKKENSDKEEVINNNDNTNIQCNCGCCYNQEDNTKFDIHVWRPFIHSLKLIGFVFIFNLIFGFIVYFIGENSIIKFLEYNKYISPILTTIIGLIPNCASSMIITKLYIDSTISFGALLSGLLINSGLGLMMIFKSKKRVRENLIIIFTLIITAIVFGYLTCLILGF